MINEPKTRSILGALLRAFLILFAVAGTPHLLRIVREPPSLTDLYPVWLGSRELLLDHRNPYSPEVSREIQVAFYGKELGPGDHPDQQCCFAYPAYVSFLLAPTINADFDDARRIMLFLLSALTAASVICWHVVTRRGSSWLALTTLLVLVSPPVMQGLELRQLGMLVAALLSVSAFLADRRHFALSGVALALATVKPQMSILPIAWMMLWAIHGWAARKSLVISFLCTMAFFVGAGELLLPGWISLFAAQLPLYRHFAGASILGLVYNRKLEFTFTIIFAGGLVWLMWRKRGVADFVPTLAFIMAIEVVTVPGLKSLLNLVLLIPGIFILLSKYPVLGFKQAVDVRSPDRERTS